MSSTTPPQASSLVSSSPDASMLIRRLHPQLLILSTPFYRFSRIRIGGRATIVKLADSSLAVFSPVALTETVKSRIHEELGSSNVKYITALDQEHHIYLESWHKAWPEAKVIAPETLPSYREKQGYFKIPEENLRLVRAQDKDTPAGNSIDATFDSEFDLEYVDAHPSKELIFHHRPTRTLIEADLFFNLPASEQHSLAPEGAAGANSGLLTRLVVALSNTKGNATWQKRFLWYGISNGAGDRRGFSRSMGRIAGWDIDRIIPCHGDVIETGGKGIFERVMEWHLKAAREEGKKGT